jgi:hypothetical protein
MSCAIAVAAGDVLESAEVEAIAAAWLAAADS